MVAGFAFVSYVQRMNISIAAELVMPELSLTKTQMGLIFGSFLWVMPSSKCRPAGSGMQLGLE